MADRRAVFVVNPASDGGSTGKKWPEIADAARRHGLEVVERLTESAGPRHRADPRGGRRR